MEAVELVDINALYALIRRDRDFLDRIDRIPFVDTPLHAAAWSGNVDLVIEIMRLKPSFGGKLNPDGFSPIHLALQNGQTQTVLQFIDIDPDLARVKGREGITPLHFASEKGDLYLLAILLSACPKSLEDVTNKGETALHTALKSDKVEAFEVLARRPPWLGLEEAQYYNNRILNSRDRDGNTLLHIAASKNLIQIIKCLIDCKVDLNVRNSEALTPLDVIVDPKQTRNAEIETMLRNAGALEATSLPVIDPRTHLLRTDQRLNEAAQAGNVDALYSLIWEDAYLLEKIDRVPLVDTPLHIAASMGHINFALDIMRLKPSFARKQNQYGFSPLHLALQKKHTQMVLRLIDVDRNLVRVRGREGVTPLHYVAENGNVDLLCKFLAACPESILQVTIRKETALHVAAKNDKLEVIEVMLGWLRYVHNDDILNWKDDEGNTLLHISISRSHMQMVRPIISRVSFQIDARNSAGMTAMDMLDVQLQTKPEFEELKSMVRRAGGRKGASLPVVNVTKYLKTSLPCYRKMALFLYRSSVSVTDKNRNELVVVAILIATATFQTALTPPQDLAGKSSSAINSATKVTTTSFSINNNRSIFEGNRFDPSPSSGDIYGQIITAFFMIFNIIAFCCATLVIECHLPYGSTATLLCPLWLCFFFLVAGRNPLMLLVIILYFFVVRFGLHVQLDYSKFPARRNSWVKEVFGSFFKHYRSFRNEIEAADP